VWGYSRHAHLSEVRIVLREIAQNPTNDILAWNCDKYRCWMLGVGLSSQYRYPCTGVGSRGGGYRRHAGFRVQGSGCRVQGSGFRVQGSGYRVQGSGFRVHGVGLRAQGSGHRVQGLWCGAYSHHAHLAELLLVLREILQNPKTETLARICKTTPIPQTTPTPLGPPRNLGIGLR